MLSSLRAIEAGEDFALPINLAIKLAVFGCWGVGKTALIRRYTLDEFDEAYTPSRLDVVGFNAVISGETCDIGLWDTPGRTKFGAYEAGEL